MKRIILTVLMFCLLLCGCGSEQLVEYSTYQGKTFKDVYGKAHPIIKVFDTEVSLLETSVIDMIQLSGDESFLGKDLDNVLIPPFHEFKVYLKVQDATKVDQCVVIGLNDTDEWMSLSNIKVTGLEVYIEDPDIWGFSCSSNMDGLTSKDELSTCDFTFSQNEYSTNLYIKSQPKLEIMYDYLSSVTTLDYIGTTAEFGWKSDSVNFDLKNMQAGTFYSRYNCFYPGITLTSDESGIKYYCYNDLTYSEFEDVVVNYVPGVIEEEPVNMFNILPNEIVNNKDTELDTTFGESIESGATLDLFLQDGYDYREFIFNDTVSGNTVH